VPLLVVDIACPQHDVSSTSCPFQSQQELDIFWTALDMIKTCKQVPKEFGLNEHYKSIENSVLAIVERDWQYHLILNYGIPAYVETVFTHSSKSNFINKKIDCPKLIY
jgi:hypothetical protein